jgi:hypothetical protein
MENQKNTLFKLSMNYGLMTGLVIIVYSLILFFVGMHLNQTMGYFAILILAVCILLFTKQYRDTICAGTISYGQAYGLGILIGVFAAILLGFFTFLELTYIDPTMIEKQVQIMQEKLLAKGMSEDQVEQALNMSKKWMTPGMMFLMSTISFAFWSAIISLITSAMLKKNTNPFENNQNTSTE